VQAENKAQSIMQKFIKGSKEDGLPVMPLVWAAWGSLIEKREYLITLLLSIVNMPELQNCSWVIRGKPTKDGHPHHPLYVNKEEPFSSFDITRYMSLLNERLAPENKSKKAI
jgi:hypothetical protein